MQQGARCDLKHPPSFTLTQGDALVAGGFLCMTLSLT